MKEWSMSVELPHVRKLILGHVSDPQVLSYLIDEVDILYLETFGITLVQATDERSLIHEMTRLINRLRDLKDIRLAGYHLNTSILDQILERHGSNLRRLTLSPLPGSGIIKSREIQKIESHCQQLQFLKMTIKQPSANIQLSDVCPNLDTLRGTSLQIGAIAGNDIPEKIENTICQQKRTRLDYLKILSDKVSVLPMSIDWRCGFDNPILTSDSQHIYYFSRGSSTQSSNDSSKASENVSSLFSVAGNRDLIFNASHGAPTSWMIETELTEVFHGLPTAKFREGEPIYS